MLIGERGSANQVLRHTAYSSLPPIVVLIKDADVIMESRDSNPGPTTHIKSVTATFHSTEALELHGKLHHHKFASERRTLKYFKELASGLCQFKAMIKIKYGFKYFFIDEDAKAFNSQVK